MFLGKLALMTSLPLTVSERIDQKIEAFYKILVNEDVKLEIEIERGLFEKLVAEEGWSDPSIDALLQGTIAKTDYACKHGHAVLIIIEARIKRTVRVKL